MAEFSILKRLTDSERTIIENSLRLKYALSCINVARGMSYSIHTPKQSVCIIALNEKDVIACLTTVMKKP